MRRFTRVMFLTSIWVLLWGKISVANIASGVVLSIILLGLYPPGAAAEPRRVLVVRPGAIAHLFGYVVVQIVVANVQISRQILTPRWRAQAGVVTYHFQTRSKRLITFVSTVLAMSPGTMPVHVEVDPPLLAVHVLRLKDPEATRRAIARLEQLTIRAFAPSEPAEASL